MTKFLRTLLQRSYLALIAIPFKLMPSLAYMAFTGRGSTAQLCSHMVRQGFKRVLIVSDKPLVDLGIVARAVDVLTEEGVVCTIYDGILPDPTFAMVDEGLALQAQHNCDAVLAIGGGSSIDCAKTIVSAATNGRNARKLVGYFKVKQAPLALFVLPTTSGTGSEATIAAVISDQHSHEKCFIADPKMLPKAVALDADLLLGMPAGITAATGMDALTHAIETYISLWGTETSNAYGYASVKMIFEYLPRAYREGSDAVAREQMALAAYYSGMAINDAGVGNVHAIAHQLGRQYGTPHGLANALVMPAVLRFMAVAAQAPLARLGRLIEVAAEGDTDQHAAEKFIDAVADLNRRLGIPEQLDSLREEDIPAIAEAAVKEGAGYPVAILMSKKECQAILNTLLASPQGAAALA
ncbi:Alcohol dehydrogenase 2 [Zhongshania aliphaticivorans]|uniref:Alcohol dehydrogenase 2 n=1 Tax=Zhongshania aliphaticivorans TaxID=1470434 RepID=A0A5S9N771_9GAMM|nr:iron-containing alcohol dehydrogenase [Zhongshania aliphaticivorans]CAA0080742.1 Alcohol dehydrogenase 2 [Zhongshania aliphaticivorans]CAA0085408.1 Alcohol dehydrogenase 2 [Zhongshania aliphaticivorans]